MANSTVPLSHTIPQAVERTGVGRSKLYEAMRTGDLPIIKVGKRTLVLESDLQDWLHRHRVSKSAA
jgi:excisionase family DNA binding protein